MKNTVDKVYLGLGSNLGDRLENLSQAVAQIRALPNTHLRAVSSIYETEPRFYTAQPNFLNACVHIQTQLSALELLHKLQGIENKLGRARSIPNGPRTLDLDILLYGHSIVGEDNLIIPHPGLHKRTFVLVPLVEIMKESPTHMHHPLLNATIPDLLTQLRADAPDVGWVRKLETQRNASTKLSPTSQLTPK